MIKVIVGTNTDRYPVLVSPETTLRQVFNQEGIDYADRMVQLDGAPIRPGDLDKTFEFFGITNDCYLIVIQKRDNA